jgi:trk system potassium uptake protein
MGAARFLSPGRLLILGFALAIMLGMLALMLPGMVHAGQHRHSPLEALFQATSAICVTGLSLRDLADYSLLGQILMMVLIQIGGIGILTVSKVIILAQGRDLRLGDRDLVDTAFGHVRAVSPRDVLRQTMVFTGICELLGFIALAPPFIHDHGWSNGLWAAAFHSVSAFCNAGFGLWRDSLGSYRDSIWVNGVIMTLVIAGGLGFVVVAELWRRWRKKHSQRQLSLHTRVVVWTSLLLILGGALLFAAIEYFNPADDALSGDMLGALFLSVSARTAGFASTPIDSLSHPSLLILMILMLIGGSPGSTAGGMKTTTVATLFALIRARARGRTDAELCGRAIGTTAVGKALATTASMFVAGAIATIALEIAQSGLNPHSGQTGHLLDHAFEAVSALCTVGLSTGITTNLNSGGRTIIIICMFAGRIGPLLIAGAVLARSRNRSYQLPREDLVIG